MKFLVDKFRLEGALSPILSAVPAKESPKPSLKSIHLSAQEDALVLKGSNMELSIETELDTVKVERFGECLMPARTLASLLHEISDPTVEISVEEGKLHIPTSSGSFEIVTGDASEFPEIQFDMEGNSVQVPLQILQELFSTTEFACAREATKYAMNGVMLSFRDGAVIFVATDGRRLALNSKPLDIDPGLELEALLPHKSLGATLRALQGLTEDLVRISFGDGSVCFSAPEGRISIQKIMGSFPDYRAVIPRETSNSVEFQRDLLEKNLRRTSVLTEAINPAVRIGLEGAQCQFEADAAGLGSARTTMDVALQGPGGKIIFNPNFIFDALKVAQVDPVRFEFEDGNAPGKFTLGEQFVYVLMPITGV